MKRIFIISTCIIGLLIGGFITLKCHTHRSGFDEEGYRQEIDRFEHVIATASNKELQLMLRLAIYYGYVPVSWNDPYHDASCGIKIWYRTRLIYQALYERNRDLLCQIYPDLDILNQYVNSAGYILEKEDKDTTDMEYFEKWNYNRGRKMYFVHESMMQNLAPDSAIFEFITDFPRTGLYKKYFGTPLFNMY